MKLASTLTLMLNLGASTASPTTSEPSTSLAPTSEPSTPPSQKPTVTPTVEQCSADVLVPIGYYDNDDYDWIELPECVQKAGELFD
jgi:hypothetical protein